MKNFVVSSKYIRLMLRSVIAAIVVLAPMLSTAAYAAPLVIDKPITLKAGETLDLYREEDIEINANITQRGNTGEVSIQSGRIFALRQASPSLPARPCTSALGKSSIWE